MLINADFKQLEWLCACYLSKDKVGTEEIINGVDLHSDNQERLRLPSRLLAKTFLFRLIYGGSAYSYANDPDFTPVSRSKDYWQSVIDSFYSKYRGLRTWHASLLRKAAQKENISIPTGREFSFKSKIYGKGEPSDRLPRTKILNYPVQGLGADLMMCARVSLRQKLAKLFGGEERVLFGEVPLLLASVHDSILLDTEHKNVRTVCDAVFGVWDHLPEYISNRFNIKFDLPTRVEVKIGDNWDTTTLITKEMLTDGYKEELYWI